MTTFKLREVFPIIERIISDLCATDGIAYRDEIAWQILQKTDGRGLVSQAFERNEKGRSERTNAGNMVDWFSAKFNTKDVLTESARRMFGREKFRGKWACFPLDKRPQYVEFNTVSEPAIQIPCDAHTISEKRPRVFISYSHDSNQHKEWVRRLAGNLEENGIETVFGQWNLNPGSDMATFMEAGVRESQYVVVVCTPNYVDKADDGQGGVGYEKMIITADLVLDQGTDKFIPIVVEANDRPTPACISSRIYVDFSDESHYAISLDNLVRILHGIPKHRRPQPGSKQYAPDGSGTARVRF